MPPLDSPRQWLAREWDGLTEIVERETVAPTSTADEVEGVVHEARRIAGELAAGVVDAADAVARLHAGPTVLLGHPPGFLTWCDLDQGLWQDPSTLRLRRVEGAEKDEVARAAARSLLEEDVADLVLDATEHLERASALRPGVWRIRAWIPALLWLGWVGWAASESVRMRSFPPPTLIVVVLTITAALFVHATSRSVNAGDSSPVQTHDRPRVVLLRPFGVDKVGGEAKLVAALRRWGEVTAIGHPGQTLPPLGARRVYLSPRGDAWKAVAARLIQSAHLVVLRVGPHVPPGFRWEIEHVLEHEDPSRLFLALPRRREAYEAFRLATADLFPHPLPRRPTPPWKEFGSAGARPRDDGAEILDFRTLFVGFDAGWRPVQLREKLRVSGSSADSIAKTITPRLEGLAPKPAL